METKRCAKCDTVKPVEVFWKNHTRADGLQAYCKPCFSQGYNKNSARVRYRLEALAVLGGSCVRCGFSDYRALQIDHVNGGGNQERKKKPGNQFALYRKIASGGTDGFQLLCANCNWIKRYENDENGSYYRV